MCVCTLSDAGSLHTQPSAQFYSPALRCAVRSIVQRSCALRNIVQPLPSSAVHSAVHSARTTRSIAQCTEHSEPRDRVNDSTCEMCVCSFGHMCVCTLSVAGSPYAPREQQNNQCYNDSKRYRRCARLLLSAQRIYIKLYSPPPQRA